MEHTKPEGLAVIEALYELGEALGYSAQREHTVGQSAAVDLSWTAADSNDVPLFIFEVESTASTGIANNAMKVYGSPMSDLPRPLFFFHLVLEGSKDNERIRNAQNMWGQHNYRVYRFNDPNDRSALALEILRQHRRVSRYLQPAQLADALNNTIWGGRSTVTEALKLSESILFDAPYMHDYAIMARNDAYYLDLFVSRLRYLDELPAAAAERKHLSREGYGGGPGDYISGLFEIGLRIYAGDIPDSQGPSEFERWATRSVGSFRTIDSCFGLSRDYDWYVIGVAPIDYSLTAALLAAHPCSRDWVLQDFNRLLASERASGTDPRFRWPASIWLAHMLCVTSVDGYSAIGTSLDIESLYLDLQAWVNEGGGIPLSLLVDPPGASGAIDEKPDWWDDANIVPLPPRHDLISLATDHWLGEKADVGLPEPAALCLAALVGYGPYASPTRELLKVIYNRAVRSASTETTRRS